MTTIKQLQTIADRLSQSGFQSQLDQGGDGFSSTLTIDLEQEVDGDGGGWSHNDILDIVEDVVGKDFDVIKHEFDDRSARTTGVFVRISSCARYLIDTVLCQHEKTTQIDVDDFVEEGSTTHYMRGYCYPQGKFGCGSDPFVEIVEMIDADPKGEEGEVVAEIDIDCNLSPAKVGERAADVFNAWCDGDGYIEYAERQIESMVEQYLEDAAMRQLEDRFYG
tara:strand:- start:8560 stop:9222 length:663 start_codon:yes stop_codon:yes gene_type:complete